MGAGAARYPYRPTAPAILLIPESKMKEIHPPKKTLPRSMGHHKEWINACKAGTPTRSNFDFASLVTETVLLGTISVRMGGQRLLWDSENLTVTNVKKANEYLHYEYRSGWSL